ncbi:hypothetical protein O6H91_14G012300 [Diphasiastrum complanatum]|uniref:Uncharacterized protein n=1 Tax=Diphasiastrum complanatum TaxID=34168 RepID=A0ACC2BLJ3_DIPCM|nr:hypothetical protein O6H91_14G012300 [Diphasiastrum complanatum]
MASSTVCLGISPPCSLHEICSAAASVSISNLRTPSWSYGVAHSRGKVADSSCVISGSSNILELRAKNCRTSICRAGMKGNGNSFFDCSIVQAESERLMSDYQYLIKLGINYGRFDREGKLLYVDEMKKLIARWQIFYKRMDLSDDFVATIYAKKLKTQVGPLGLSNVDLADSMHVILDEMKKDADAGM